MPHPSPRGTHPLLARARYITIGLVSAGVLTTGVLYVSLEAADQASAQTSSVVEYASDSTATSPIAGSAATQGRYGSLSDAGSSPAHANTGAS